MVEFSVKIARKELIFNKIKKEEIFTFNPKEKFSFIDIVFDSSYRKIIDSKDYIDYKEYKINIDFIEEKMTNLLLNNKKLLIDKIFEFINKNETFQNEISGLISTFEDKYTEEELIINNKVDLYKYTKEKKGNIISIKNAINKFIYLFNHLIKSKNKEEGISEESNISDVIKDDDYYKELKAFFAENKSFIVAKLPKIFEYYLILIFEDVKNEIEEYQEEKSEISKQIENYNEEKHIIKKEDFAKAIRLFITLVLFLEEDKDNKIKSNRNNIVNYFNGPDLWGREKYKEDYFKTNLNELKKYRVLVCNILELYKKLGEDIKDDFFTDDLKYMKQEEKKSESESNVDDDEDSENVLEDDNKSSDSDNYNKTEEDNKSSNSEKENND